MIIDCDECQVRGPACGDCVVSVLLGMPQLREPVELDAAEARAISVLAGSGLVPPLRLVTVADGEHTYDDGHGSGAARAG